MPGVPGYVNEGRATMSARMSKADEIELARGLLDHAYALVEGGEDTIYELLDPTCKYGDDLPRRLNNYTVREILALGFRAKYGEDWHEPQSDGEERGDGQRS